MQQYKGEASPVIVYIYKGENRIVIAEHKTGGDDGSIPFGWFWLRNKKTSEQTEKEFYVGEPSSDHGDITTTLLDYWSEDNNVHPVVASNTFAGEQEYCGRVWPNEKVFAFFASNTGYPDKKRMKFIIDELEAEAGLSIDNDYKVCLCDIDDERSKTNDWHLINIYSLREFMTGMEDSESNVDVANKRNISDFVRDKYAGEKAYQDYQANDPRADRMYKDFVAENKKRKGMKTLVLNERQCKLLRIDECIDEILNEMLAPSQLSTPRAGEYAYKGNGTQGDAAKEAAAAGYTKFCMIYKSENQSHFDVSQFPAAYAILNQKQQQPRPQATNNSVANNTTTPANTKFRTRTYGNKVYTLFPQNVLEQYIASFKKKYGKTLTLKVAASYYGIDNGFSLIGIDDGTNASPIWAIDNGVRTGRKGYDAALAEKEENRIVLGKGMTIVYKLIEIGYAPIMAIAITANIYIESGRKFSPYALLKDAGGTAKGLCQWRGIRQSNKIDKGSKMMGFVYWVNKEHPECHCTDVIDKNVPESTLINLQLEFLNYEITNYYDKSGNWKRGLLQSGTKGTLDKLVAEFERVFEVANGGNMSERLDYSKKLLEEYNRQNKK